MNAMSSTIVSKNRRTCHTSWMLRDRMLVRPLGRGGFVLRHMVDAPSLDRELEPWGCSTGPTGVAFCVILSCDETGSWSFTCRDAVELQIVSEHVSQCYYLWLREAHGVGTQLARSFHRFTSYAFFFRNIGAATPPPSRPHFYWNEAKGSHCSMQQTPR
jgi:hypothetical protein